MIPFLSTLRNGPSDRKFIDAFPISTGMVVCGGSIEEFRENPFTYSDCVPFSWHVSYYCVMIYMGICKGVKFINFTESSQNIFIN